jgi:hypothetical protein
VNVDDFLKSHHIDGKVKSSYARRASHLKPSGAILRNEEYLSYVAMIYPVKSAPPSRVARI